MKKFYTLVEKVLARLLKLHFMSQGEHVGLKCFYSRKLLSLRFFVDFPRKTFGLSAKTLGGEKTTCCISGNLFLAETFFLKNFWTDEFYSDF